ncbi:MAG: hypothetical protein WCJ70_02855 [bacterium]
MDPLLLYIAASVLFIMVIHFAVGISKEFDTWIMTGIFVLGGVLGWYFEGYAIGFVFAVVFTFLFW